MTETISAADYRKRRSKRRKYHNVPVIADGIRFDSQTEYRRYEVLKQRQEVGAIADLRCHPKYVLHVNGQKLGTYSADFAYVDAASGDERVEDLKSPVTAREKSYLWKRKHLFLEYGIAVKTVLDPDE